MPNKIHPHSAMTPRDRELLGRKVATAFGNLAAHRGDIIALWREFARLAPGQTIMGCATKTEYCDRIIGRSMRAIQYLIGGGNHKRERETVSRPAAALPHTVSPQLSQQHLKLMLLCLLMKLLISTPGMSPCHCWRNAAGYANI